ncbi:MAG: hypothetical protein IKA43_04370, partial [Clostridia bacterium]|nr:hypothetical protein [Clostridia bacterium]
AFMICSYGALMHTRCAIHDTGCQLMALANSCCTATIHAEGSRIGTICPADSICFARAKREVSKPKYII